MNREHADRSTEIRVVASAGYALLIEALQRPISDHPSMKLVAWTHDLSETLDIVQRHRPDVLVMLLTSPAADELDVVARVAANHEETRLLVLSFDPSEQLALRILRSGAHGILPRQVSSAELVDVIRRLWEGEVYLTPDLQRLCAERYLGVSSQAAPEERLSDREYQVLRFLAAGATNREIAGRLGIGVKTVDTHRANLLRKLELRNNSDITRYAIKHGLIEP